MRNGLLCGAVLASLFGIGCGQTSSYVKSDTTLGRVVVYRNGVAYFERYADVQGDSLKLSVPSDKVDDFLKSLTVVDAKTGEPAPVSYPSLGTGGTIDMKIGGNTGQGSGPRRLKLSYVTEAPSWKPSYRFVVGKDGEVEMQGWAIVDNTSGEDWHDVKLGVGASSAMSFRYDLRGLRMVQRETLRENDLFAQAPPMGGATYGQTDGRSRVLADIGDDVLASAAAPAEMPVEAPAPVKAARTASGGGAGRSSAPRGAAMEVAPPPGSPPRPNSPVVQMAQSLRNSQSTIVVEGYATAADKDKEAASLDRANKLRDQLIRNGVNPSQVVALGKGAQAGRNGGARVVEAPPEAEAKKTETPRREDTSSADVATAGAGTEPIGTSHFESKSAMTVARGSSAMVSILRSKTEGEVVYLYDPESPRGNAQFPFRTLRFKNPTGSALESGPVSVFGENRFIGEGLAEPIPAKATAFVPFALDRQIVVERKDDGKDEIARIISVQRGVFNTEIQHKKQAKFTLFNRMPEKATVYLRHTVARGYTLTQAPGADEGAPAGKGAEHLAGAHLFRIELEPNGKREVVVEETTPVYRTTDIRTPEGLGLVRAYLSNAALKGPLREQVAKLMELHADMTKIDQQIVTQHEQMAEYRARMDELHGQIFTLKAVKTAGPLMAHLEKKLQEMSEKLSRATLDVVALQEKQMVARIGFQNGVGELTLDDAARAVAGVDGKESTAKRVTAAK